MKVVILGGNGGIGLALVQEIKNRYPSASIDATWRSKPPARNKLANWSQVDIADQHDIAKFAESVDEIDWLINAGGLLHTREHGPEKTIRQFDPTFLEQNIRANTLPTLLMAKYFMNHFRHGRRGVFATVSAKVGSIEDNQLGGWYSYRCSKAALNMAIKTISIEWRRTRPAVCVTALHPGTTNTALSRPFQANLPTGQLFSPATTAGYLVDILGKLVPEQTGKFFAFDGEELPW